MAVPARETPRVVHPEPQMSEGNPRVAQDVEPLVQNEGPSARRTAEVPATTAPAADGAAAKPKSAKRKKIIIGVGALAALALIYFGIHYIFVGRYMISTDDAYVRANNTTLGAKVAGHIAKIGIADNKRVGAGNILFQIDDGDYRLAVENARAKIATQQATIERIGRQESAQQSAVDQAKAQLVSAEAATKRAQADFVRQEELSAKGFASKATFDVSQAARDQAVAAVEAAKATLEAAQTQVDVIKAQKAEAEGTLQELRAALAKAVRDLSFTEVRAPVDGIFSNRLVNVGDFVQPGQRLANVVPLDDVYIDANYKETQLGRLRPGQPVSITVDGVGGRTIMGIVDSLAPASGSVFTLLPPDNATGNFTKIVQRVPVRIRVPFSVARENLLRPGMSVVTTINTKPNPDGIDPIAAR
ncbi:HlyD family secretion protein [Bradyrhizobium sp. SYSU BS000235]|uniref:HlyD family secretion protein n=1 Tax=Bradyrhizobium sp. SYSU BS000235 TaxID=3411332 RepID=UPI003C7442CE